MDELLNFLQHTYKKYAGMERDKKSIVLEISRDDLQILIESVKQMGKAKMFQDEIDRLKQQCAENLEAKDNLVKMQSETIQYLEREVTKFDGYRQAVKDILGGEG